MVGHVTTALGHVINILAHNHMQCCKKTQRQCNRTCYTLEGGTIESQISPKSFVCAYLGAHATLVWAKHDGVGCLVMKTSLRDKEQHQRKPLCIAALSSLPLGQISFMISHAANDENWGLRGWERGYASLALIPDRGHRNGTTA